MLPLFIEGVAVAVSLISFRNGYPPALRKLSVLWIVNFLFDIAGHLLKHYGKVNHWLYNINFSIVYLALAWLYREQLKDHNLKAAIKLFVLLFPVLIVADSFYSGIYHLQSRVVITGAIAMVTLTVMYFRQLYLTNDHRPIQYDPWFWFSFGFLIHFGCTMPFLGMLNYINSVAPVFTSTYYLYFCNSFTIFLNILIIKGYLCHSHRTTPLRSQ